MCLFILLIFIVEQAIRLLRYSRGMGGCLVQLLSESQSHQGVGKWRTDSYCVVAAGGGEGLVISTHWPCWLHDMGPWGRERMEGPARPTYHYLSLPNDAGGGGSAPHCTPLTLLSWGSLLPPGRVWKTSPMLCWANYPSRRVGAPPGSTGEKWKIICLLGTNRRRDQSAVCFSTVEEVHGGLQKVSSWLSPAKTTLVGR